MSEAAPASGEAASPTRRRRWRGLFVKYVLALIGLVTFVLVVNGCLDVWFAYRDAKETALRVQQEKAEAAAQRIQQFVAEIERQIGWTTHAQWAAGTVEQRRFDYVRLLRQVPAITEIVQLDAAGKEQLKVSRLAMDVVGSEADWSQDSRFAEAKAQKLWFSPVYFRKESEPYMSLAVARSGRNAGVTVAEVNLKLIWDVVTAIKVGATGYAYVVDGKGRLIAHPDISLVLRNTDLSRLTQVAAARAAGGQRSAQEHATITPNLDGREVIAAHAAIAPLDWLVFVELPLREALAPLITSALQTGALLLLGLILASGAGLLMARRMVVPIRTLEAGAARLGEGRLGHRIEVHTRDELEALAQSFNRMSEQLEESYAGLERKVEARTSELTEALEQQTATADVLRVISSSPGDLAPVFDAMLENATRICEAEFGWLWTYDGKVLKTGATSRGVPPQMVEVASRGPILPERGMLAGRVLLDRRIVQVDDVLNDPDYTWTDAQRAGSFRTALGVPLFREGEPIGVFSLFRARVEPFTEKQVALVTTFADQAVIAIENARLLAELRGRTEELQESLEHQTATSDVLQVISRSPADLEPVFGAMLENAVRICAARCGVLFICNGPAFEPRALCNVPEPFAEVLRQRATVPPSPRLGLGRLAATRRPVHIHDLATEDVYRTGEPWRVATVDLAGARTWLGVPMLKGDTMVGAVVIYREEVQPFSDKQIDLVATFANQAVIAIENARLLGELQARTAELARSVEELQSLREVGQAVSATLDLGTVLATIVERAVDLSGADAGAIYRYRRSERVFRLGTSTGFGDALAAAIRGVRIREEETTAMARAVQERVPVQIPDLGATPNFPLRDLTYQAGFRSVLMVPLVGADRVVGVLAIQRKTIGEVPEESVRLMQTFAAQSVLAIQNARLFREVEEQGRALAVASQHKSQFLANMSHELRTPLNAVLGYAELLVDGIYGALPAKAQVVLERIQTNGRHLLGLINDVLDLSKIEAGQLDLTIEDYSMAGIVQSVRSATESLAQTKGLKLVTSIAEAMPIGRGDERRLTQVLLNLVGNAIKFTDAGEVEIAAAAAGGVFEVAVRDTGPGIAEADQGRIFEEFHQVDNTSTRKKGGTGLGLAISKRIVALHGGTLGVASVLGEGSTFRIVIPVRVEEKKEAAE
jgi:signal transduction histidine kinase